jgi:hypothetical protein
MPGFTFWKIQILVWKKVRRKKDRQCEKQRKEEYILKSFLPVRGKIWAKRRWINMPNRTGRGKISFGRGEGGG